MRSARVFFGHLPLAFRLAVREMRGGLRGFYIFMLCILLGTAAIAGVNSVGRSMTSAIDAQGREILAGDIRFGLKNREATTEERAYLDSLGKVQVSTSLRSMPTSTARSLSSGGGMLWRRIIRLMESSHCARVMPCCATSLKPWQAVQA